MARFEVELTLVRTVTVVVEADSVKDAREVALFRSRWLSSRGMRGRLRLLCSTARRV